MKLRAQIILLYRPVLCFLNPERIASAIDFMTWLMPQKLLLQGWQCFNALLY